VTMGLVSDIDDTVISTSLPRMMIAAWNTFVKHEGARRVVPGMAPMYRDLLAEHPGAPIVYVSTGAWNTAPTLNRFLRSHGYPVGPLLLTDWGPTNTGWFRSGQEHKRASLDRLAKDFPRIRWLLVGDDGQHDPKIYQDFAEARPEVVDAIAIRQLTPTEQVLSHGLPVSNEELQPRTSRAPREVPVYYAPDGYGLLEILRNAGKVGAPQ
jgi:phosphatidate phosphatase APP1